MLPFDNESSIITNNNEVLKNAEIYLKDKIYGPESLAIHEETQHIFSGLRNGLIIEMDINEQGEVDSTLELLSHRRTTQKCFQQNISDKYCSRVSTS